MKTFFAALMFLSVTGSAVASSRVNLHAPVRFEPNQGQASGDWKYRAVGTGYQAEISQRGYRINLLNTRASAALNFQFAGSTLKSSFEPLNRMAATSNYFHGQNPSAWKTGVANFESVRQTGIWPGIDAVYHGDLTQLEYDFVVAPGADPRAIRIAVQGAQAIRLDATGNLELETAAGTAVQHAPKLFQMAGAIRLPVTGNFVLGPHHEVSIQVGAYDRTLPLVIDPTLSYSTFIGGSGSEQGNAIAVDPAGNVYVAGSTSSTSKGDKNVLIRKFTAAGALVYTADLGGSNDDFGFGIGFGSDGSVYVAGQTASSDFPLTNASQSTRGGSTAAFISRLNPNGQGMIFSTYLGGTNSDFASAIAVDTQGAAYVTGTANSSDFPATSGVYQIFNQGGKDAFVVKFNSAGTRIYSTLLGGSADDEGKGIAVDAAGNAYVTGTTLSDGFPQVNNPYQHSRHGDVDAFVTEVNPAGVSLVYSTFLGGLFSDTGYAIAVDSAGSAYVAGKTASLDFPVTNGAYSRTYSGGDNDIFVTKFTSGQAGLVYSTYIGSRGTDEGFALAVDGSGAVFVAGNSNSDAYPVTSDAVQGTRKGNRDVVVSKIDPTGANLAYSTFLGGSQDDIGYGIAVTGAGNVYVTGITSSSDFPVTGSPYQGQFGGSGNSDAFLAQIQFATTAPPVVPSGSIVNGGTFAAGPVAAGSIISIFGTNLSASTVSAANLPLPTSLGGATVTINGRAVPLFYASPSQINAQVPYETAAGQATLQVNTSAGSNAATSFTLAQAAPYLITSNNRAVAMNQDGTLNSSSNPAKGGSIIVAYFTGTGAVNATVVSGAASPAAMSTAPSSATVGGANAQLMYVGLTPGSVGLGQANIVVPTSGSGDVPLILTIGGVSSNSAVVAVSQ